MSSTPADECPRSSLDTDDSLHFTRPVLALTSDSHNDLPCSTARDPTFIQNQVALQRNPSVAKAQVSSLSRQLSTKSNASHDAGLSQSGILSVLAYSDNKNQSARNGSIDSSLDSSAHSLHVGSLKSSNSRSTIRSNASVQSVPAVGTLPLGSLRLHQPGFEKEQKSPTSECLASGDVVIVSGMPTGALFGLDTFCLSIVKDSQFEGIRDIPSGPHFIYGSSTSDISTRNGFWIMSEKRATGESGKIFVRRWSDYNETLEDEVSAAEVRIQKDNVPQIFESLLPYSIEELPVSQSHSKSPGNKDQNMWQRLTHAIKGIMLSNITGNRWNKWQVSSNDERKPTEWTQVDARTGNVLHSTTDRSELMAGKDMVLSFAFPQTGNTFSSDVIGRARTEQAMDTSAHIMTVVGDRCMDDEDWVIGELQFCYVTGIMLGNITCQEQWAHLVRVVFRAFRLSMDKPVFFRKIIEVVHSQLIYDEEGVEGSIFDHDEGLQEGMKILLTIFKSRLNEQLLAKGSAISDEQNAVGTAFEALESWLWKWGWDLRGNYLRSGKIQLEDGEFVDAELAELQAEDERGEWAPVVVQLEEDGRERGLVTW